MTLQNALRNAQPGTVTIQSNHGSFSGAPQNLAAHIVTLNRSHLQEPPGSEILRQKLARAQAVAPEQRKDEETAFIDSVALMRCGGRVGGKDRYASWSGHVRHASWSGHVGTY